MISLFFITLSLYHSTPTTWSTSQWATPTSTLFFALEPPLQKRLKPFTIILTPWPFHLPPDSKYQHNLFSKFQVFLLFSWHRSKISCWKLNSKIFIRRFYIYWSTSKLNSSPRVCCFFSYVGSTKFTCYVLWGVPPPYVFITIIKQ